MNGTLERHGSLRVSVGPLDDRRRMQFLVPSTPERRVRAANVAVLKVEGHSLARIGEHLGVTRDRVRQLDNVGRRVLTYSAMGLLASIRRSEP